MHRKIPTQGVSCACWYVVPMVTDATVLRGPIFFVWYLNEGTIALIFRFQLGLQMFSPDPNRPIIGPSGSAREVL